MEQVKGAGKPAPYLFMRRIDNGNESAEKEPACGA